MINVVVSQFVDDHFSGSCPGKIIQQIKSAVPLLADLFFSAFGLFSGGDEDFHASHGTGISGNFIQRISADQTHGNTVVGIEIVHLGKIIPELSKKFHHFRLCKNLAAAIKALDSAVRKYLPALCRVKAGEALGILIARTAVAAVFTCGAHDDRVTPGRDPAAAETAEFCFGASFRTEIPVFRRVTHIPGPFAAVSADLDFRLKCQSEKRERTKQ